MIRTIFFILFFWLYQVAISPLLLVVVLLKWQKKFTCAQHLAVIVGKNWASGLLRLAGIRVRVHGKASLPSGQAALFVGNHQGAFDIPILLACLGYPAAFIAKVELRNIPSVGLWMNHIGCVFIKREDRRQSLHAIKEAIAKLQKGTSLVVFPEGTRSNSMTMRPFKKGSLSIAVKAGAPIIPVTLKGSFNARKGDSGLIQPTDVELFIDPPIETHTLTKEEKNVLHERVQKQIQQHLDA